MSKGLKERVEDIITDVFNESEGNGVSDASGNYEYIEDRVVDEATTAILTLIEKEKVKARIDEIKPYVKYVFTSNTAQRNAIKRTQHLEAQLQESEG